MLFIAFMFLSTTSVASIAAFFSVYGLAHTFTGAFWSVVAMGSSLEAGKLMLASFIYRFRSYVDWRIKLPAYAFIAALMIVTSTGIYGYLSAAYQTDTVGAQQIVASLDLKKQEQSQLQKRKDAIDQQISQLPTNDVRGRQKLQHQFDPESKQIDTRITAVTSEIQDLSQKQITADAHIGPIMYIAKMLGMEPDKAISLLMLLIIFAFDPLAMLLTISTNVAISKYQEDKAVKKAETSPIVQEDTQQPSLVSEADIWPEPSGDLDYLLTPSTGQRIARAEVGKIPDWYITADSHIDSEPVIEPITSSIERELMAPSVLTVADINEEIPTPQNVVNDEEPIIVEQEIIPTIEPAGIIDGGAVEETQEEVKPLNEEPVYDTQAEEVSFITEIKHIQKEIEEKPEVTEEEQEMKDMITKFFARQDLIRSTRRD